MSTRNHEPASPRPLEQPAFWRSLLPAISRKELSPAVNDEPRRGDFNDIAPISEDVRERCKSIVERVSELISLRQEFVDVFIEVGRLLDNTEGTNSALLERTALLANEEEEHGRLKILYRALREENEKNVSENGLLRSEVEHLGLLVSARESRVISLEGELAIERNDNVSLRNVLEQERSTHAETAQKLADAMGDVLRGEQAISKLDSQIAELSDRCSVAEFQATAIEKSLNDSQAAAKQLRAALTERQQQCEGLEKQVAEGKVEIGVLQSKLNAAELDTMGARLAHDVAHSVWREKEQEVGDEIDRLSNLVKSERARTEASEAQLVAVRAELQTASASLRAKENEIEQLLGKIAPLEECAEQSSNEVSLLSEKIAEGDRSRSALADRSQALVRSLGDLKAKLELAKERAQLLENRLTAETIRAAEDSEGLERKIHLLTKSLEKEKAARILVSKSLEAARSSKVVRRNKIA